MAEAVMMMMMMMMIMLMMILIVIMPFSMRCGDWSLRSYSWDIFAVFVSEFKLF